MTEAAPGVYYPTRAPVVLDRSTVDVLSAAADCAASGRARFCAHASPAAGLHEMLIVQNAASSVRPHRHIGRDESLLLLEGELEAFIYDDDGAVREHFTMRSYAAGGPFYYRIAPGTWHSITITSPRIVMQEVTAGPFTAADTQFATWTPDAAPPSALEHR